MSETTEVTYPVSLTRKAATQIRDAIVSGRLAFGEPLSEAQLAAALGMSKAPVRGALIELREKGLVTIAPQAGTYVCAPTSEDIDKLSGFRCLIETDAMRHALVRDRERLLRVLSANIAQMAAARKTRSAPDYIVADTAFHLAFITLSGNRYLEQAYSLISGIAEALRVRLFNAGQSFRQQSFKEHVEILASLRKGDTAGAARTLKRHIMRTVELEGAVQVPSASGRRSTRRAEDYRALFPQQSDKATIDAQHSRHR
ncbi:MAG: GntR family transcriptional regulator [Rhizobiales bacterium]|nr:GntR family transcriptional regulator [Hyphomicrobiales bacterium]